jgi:UDP-N-acetylmuramoyl-L-alanyl-D-glutamate--2,6-diaminopimelate ligase
MTEQKIETSIPCIIVPSVRKAMAPLAANFYGYPADKMNQVGVTGTNGKSSSVSLIKEILSAAGHKTGMVSSLIYDTGHKRYPAERTTPEAIELQRLLFEMHRADCTHAVLEVSSHALMLHRVDNIDFIVALYTTFSRDHLDFHKTMEQYLKAKKLLLNRMHGENSTVVLNIDIDEFAGFVDDIKCRLITYSSEGKAADVKIENARLYPNRSEFDLCTPDGSHKVTFRLPGRYNLSNAAAAAAVGVALGIKPENIVTGLQSADPIPGRFTPVDMGQPFAVVIDFAHTPDAIERLCRSARELTKGRLLILFGCGGDRDRGKRPLMGEAASRHSDFAVITSDNPRSENPQKIIDEIIPGMVNQNYTTIADRSRAIYEIINRAKPNDMVLLAGKGGEDYQEIMGKKYPYEDKVEVAGVLAKLGYTKAVAG